jgi:hypothetical protein
MRWVEHHRVVLAVLIVAALALGLATARSGLARAFAGTPPAAVTSSPAGGEPPTAGDSFVPQLGMPATHIVAFGTSPSTHEAWAYGTLGPVPAIINGKPYANQQALLDHTERAGETAGWQVVSLPLGPEEHTLSLTSGQALWDGGLVLLTDGGIVTREPGAAGELQLVQSKPTALLGEGEALSSFYAALEDPGHTGLLIVPENDGKSKTAGILHYDGSEWTRERIEFSGEPPSSFTPEALACGGTSATETDASSPANCWMLAAYKSEASLHVPNRLGLFRRTAQEPTALEPVEYKWDEVAVADPGGALLGEAHSPTSEALNVTATEGQMLTVTSQGVWVDLQAHLGNGPPTDISKLVIPTSATNAETLGTWCSPSPDASTFCSQPSQTLGAMLPAHYRSFAWPGAAKTPGTRIITGLSDREMLELSPSSGRFVWSTGAGGEVGEVPGGAAFSEPQQGWIADAANPTNPQDGAGQSQVIEVTKEPKESELQEESVPFRRPLYAVAQIPGSTPGDPSAQAIAVGELGEVTHFIPGQGWTAEALYNSAGEALPPTLRGVAWPEPGRAYAVGNEGAMWVWRAETGLWEPDPAKPLNLVQNLNAIAFSPTNPDRGYAVGAQGTLLRFGKTWEQEPTCGADVTQMCLSPELQDVTFTSVSFAGEEAIAAFRQVAPDGYGPGVETGGLAVQEGSGPWHVDSGAMALLAALPAKVVSRVAGLPDGGAVAAGPGFVIERESAAAAWQFSSQPLPEAQEISALGAYRDSSGAVRAVVSIDLDSLLNPSNSPEYSDGETVAGEPPLILPPQLLPNSGYLLKQTASGWSDMEHQARPFSKEYTPARPDPVLAVIVAPSGQAGLAVGGQTGDIEGRQLNVALDTGDADHQTAAVMRFPAAAASSNGAIPETVQTTLGEASFVVAGNAVCQPQCAYLANEDLGPDVDLTHALQMASRIATESPGGLRAFLYTGGRLTYSGEDVKSFEEEIERYGALLQTGKLPVLAATSPGDLLPSKNPREAEDEDFAPFTRLMSAFMPEDEGHRPYYSYISTGTSGGKVKVIVLAFSSADNLEVPEEPEGQQEAWLITQLKEAQENKTPAIVMGNLPLGFQLPEEEGVSQAKDAQQISAILVEGHASAYFFEYPAGDNVKATVSYGTTNPPIPAFGTGTMGYARGSEGRFEADSLRSSGFLLAEVHTSEVTETNNVVKVTAKVIPNIAQLAIDPTNGILLRRSQVALFEGLARRPLGGVALTQGVAGTEPSGPDPYDQIPFDCLGANCTYEVPTEYTFSSSNPEVGEFVAHDPASKNPRLALLGSNHLPVPDEHSGLFCPYNEGTTIVSITTGGLTYSEPVTVQGGSVEYPCGTVPLKNPKPIEQPSKFNFAPVEPAPANAPTNPLVQSILPPAPPTPVHAKPHRVPHAPPLAVVPYAPPVSGANPAIVPPPPTPAAEPTPPSGTSQVFATSPEEKKEEERALEMSANMQAVAYDANGSGGPSPWLGLMLVVIAAGAGVGIRRGRRSPERSALALASVRRHRR